MAMKYRDWAGGRVRVSELVFGTMRFLPGGVGKKADPAEGAAALAAAIELGITTFHSSYEYGVQEGFGVLLRRMGVQGEVQHIVKSHSNSKMTKDEQREFLAGQLDVLGAERIDVFQIRGSTWADEERILENVTPLIDEGLIVSTAAFAYDNGQATTAVADDRIDGLAEYVNPLKLKAAAGYPAAAALGKKVLAFQPLCEGAFSDKRPSWEELPEGDRFKSDRGRMMLGHRAKVAELLPEPPRSWPAFALSFCLSRPETAGVVVSMNTADQVRGLAKMLDGPEIDEVTWQAIRELHDKEVEAGTLKIQ